MKTKIKAVFFTKERGTNAPVSAHVVDIYADENLQLITNILKGRIGKICKNNNIFVSAGDIKMFIGLVPVGEHNIKWSNLTPDYNTLLSGKWSKYINK